MLPVYVTETVTLIRPGRCFVVFHDVIIKGRGDGIAVNVARHIANFKRDAVFKYTESHAERETHEATSILIASAGCSFDCGTLCARMQSIISPRAKKVYTGADAPE